jgi:transposase
MIISLIGADGRGAAFGCGGGGAGRGGARAPDKGGCLGKAQVREVLRVRIVLAAAEGLSNGAIARELAVAVNTVRKWRGRFALQGPDGLKDADRSGRPRTYGPEVRVAIVAAATGAPPHPEATWSHRTIAAQVADTVSAAVSASQVGRILADLDLKPHRVRGWLTRRDTPDFWDRVADFTASPAAPELGGLGVCHVRYGKAMRGSPPRRRAVATVMPWAAGALAQYLAEVRPWYGCGRHPALWLTERGGRISPRQIDDRFAAWRAAAALPGELSVHCLRHSYVSHLIEDGADPLFVQHQVGHSWASTTAVYTNPRELHQAGEKPQAAMSGRCFSGFSRAFGMAA